MKQYLENSVITTDISILSIMQRKQPPELHRSPYPRHREQIQVAPDVALQHGPIQARGVLICGKPLPPQGSRTSRVPAGTTRRKSAALMVTMQSARASIAAAAIRAS